MIHGGIDRSYSDFEHIVQQLLLVDMCPSVCVKVEGKVLIADFTVRRPYFKMVYQIQILYHSQDLHLVRVKNTEIVPSIAIHMYNDRSLCLYYPPDISPYRRIWVAKDLIPMAVLWVQHYERWLSNGNDWKGWEAPGHWFLMQQLTYRQTQLVEQLQKTV